MGVSWAGVSARRARRGGGEIVSVLTFDSKRAYDWANIRLVLGVSVFVVFSGESVFILGIFSRFFSGLMGIGFPVVRQGGDARSIRGNV